MKFNKCFMKCPECGYIFDADPGLSLMLEMVEILQQIEHAYANGYIASVNWGGIRTLLEEYEEMEGKGK